MTTTTTVSYGQSLSRVIVDEIHHHADAKLRGVPSLTGFYSVLAVLGVFPQELQMHIAARHLEQHRVSREKRFNLRHQQQQQHQHQKPQFNQSQPKQPLLHQSLLDVVVVCGAGNGQHKTTLVKENADIFDQAMAAGTSVMTRNNSSSSVKFRYKSLLVEGTPDERVAVYGLASKMVLDAAAAERKSLTVDVDDDAEKQNTSPPVLLERPVLFVTAWFFVSDILHQRISPLLVGGVVLLNAQRAGASERFALSLMQPRDAFEQAAIESQLGMNSIPPSSSSSSSSSRSDDDTPLIVPRWCLCISGYMSYVTRNPCLTTLNPVHITLFPRVHALISDWIKRHTPTSAAAAAVADGGAGGQPSSSTSDVVVDVVSADAQTADLVTVLRRIFNELVTDLNSSVMAAAEKYEAVQSMLEFFATASAQRAAAAAHTAAVAAMTAGPNFQRNHQYKPPTLIQAEALLPAHALTLLRRVVATLPVTSRCREICESLIHIRRLLRLAPRVDAGTFVCILQQIANEAMWSRQAEAAQQQQHEQQQNFQQNRNQPPQHQYGGGHRNQLIVGGGEYGTSGAAPLLWLMSPSSNELIALAQRRVYEKRAGAGAGQQLSAEERRRWQEQQDRDARDNERRLLRAVESLSELRSNIFVLPRGSGAGGEGEDDADHAEQAAARNVDVFLQRCLAQVRPQKMPDSRFVLQVPVVYRRLRELVARMLTKRSSSAGANAPRARSSSAGRRRGPGVVFIVVPHRNDCGDKVLEDVRCALTLNKLRNVQNAMINRFTHNVAGSGTGGYGDSSRMNPMVQVIDSIENMARAGAAAQSSFNDFGALGPASFAAEQNQQQQQLLVEQHQNQLDAVSPSRASATATAAASVVARGTSRALSLASTAAAPLYDEIIDENEEALYSDDDDDDDDAAAMMVVAAGRSLRSNSSRQSVARSRGTQQLQSRATSLAPTTQFDTLQQQQPPQMGLFSSDLVQLCAETATRSSTLLTTAATAVLSQFQHQQQNQDQQQQHQSPKHPSIEEEKEEGRKSLPETLGTQMIEPQQQQQPQPQSGVKTEKPTSADFVDVDALSDDDVIVAPPHESNKKSFSPVAVAAAAAATEEEEDIEIAEEPIPSLFTSDPEELELHSQARLRRDGPGELRPQPLNISVRDAFHYRMHAALDIYAVTLNAITPALLRVALSASAYPGQRQVVCLDSNQHFMRTLELFNVEESLAAAKASSSSSSATPIRVPKLRTRLIMEHGSHCFEEVKLEGLEECRNVQRLSHEKVTFTPSFQYRSTQPLFTVARNNNNSNSTNQQQQQPTFTTTSATVAKIPTVLVDDRELRAELPFWLHHERGLRIVPLTLSRGDYIVSGDLAIERKATKDLFQSIKSGRLNNQLAQMQSFFKYTMVLVELSSHGNAPAKTVDFGPAITLQFTKENFAKMLLNRVGTGVGGDAGALPAAAAAAAAKGGGESLAASVTIVTTGSGPGHLGGGGGNSAIGPIAPSAKQQFSVMWSTGPRHSAAMIQRLKLTMAANDPDPADPALAVQQAAATVDDLRSHSAREVLARIPGCGFVTVDRVAKNLANGLAVFVRSTQEQLETVLSNNSAAETWKFLNTPLTSDQPAGGFLFDAAPPHVVAGRKGKAVSFQL